MPDDAIAAPSQNETAAPLDARDDVDRYIDSLPVEQQLAIYKHLYREYTTHLADVERERREALNAAERARAANRMLRSELADKMNRLTRALDLLWAARLVGNTTPLDSGLIKEIEECLDDNIAYGSEQMRMQMFEEDLRHVSG